MDICEVCKQPHSKYHDCIELPEVNRSEVAGSVIGIGVGVGIGFVAAVIFGIFTYIIMS